MAPREAVPLAEQFMEFVRKSEEASLELGRKWVDAFNEFVPVEMPLVRDLGKHVLDFVEDILKTQREFAQRMLDETRKAVAKAPKPAPSHAPRAAKGARRTTAHKAA